VLNLSRHSTFRLLEQNGFLLVSVTSDIQQCFEATFEAARTFFNEAEKTKLENSFSRDMGFRPYAAEYSASPHQPDQVESFSVSPGMITPSIATTRSARDLCKEMLASYSLLESIAERITINLVSELSENGAGDRLRGQLHRWSLLQLNHSKPANVSGPFINESHEDGAFLTVAHAREPGLELLIRNEFVPITNQSDDVLVIPGDIAWLLSGGRIKPMFHRVRPIRDVKERMALLFFADINPRLCDAWVQNEINQDVDIGALVLKNPKRFGLQEWALEDREADESS
jgi:isopenicillin N synthase-like dioxygenase